MELSRAQVVAIEDRLHKNGLTYWDIRVEILDHIVSMIEDKMNSGESYDSALENTLQTLHYTGNLADLNRRRLLGINKIVRKQYFDKVKEFCTTPFYLLMIVAGLGSYTLVYLFQSAYVFKIVTLFLLFTPILLGVVSYIKEYAQKEKSGFLVYSSFYVFFSFMVLNLFIQFFQPEGIFPVAKETQHLIWFVVTSINGIFSAAGLIIHFETRSRIKNIELKLKNL